MQPDVAGFAVRCKVIRLLPLDPAVSDGNTRAVAHDVQPRRGTV